MAHGNELLVRSDHLTNELTESTAVIMKINSMKEMLSRSELAVANYISAHPEEVIYLSVAALADNCGVSDPTVVRACQKLGYTGYQDLKISLTQSLRTPIEIENQEVTEKDDMQTVASKVFRNASQALDLTKDMLNYSDLEQAAETIMKANHVFIYGLGGSNSVAMDAQHKLLRLGLDVRAYTDSHLQAMAAAYADKNDVILAISHSGSSKSIVDNARLAKDNGATVISLSSMGKSPLSKLSDISLYTAATEIKFRIVALSSRIAELTIIDTLYTYLAFKSGKEGSMKIEKAMESMKY